MSSPYEGYRNRDRAGESGSSLSSGYTNYAINPAVQQGDDTLTRTIDAIASNVSSALDFVDHIETLIYGPKPKLDGAIGIDAGDGIESRLRRLVLSSASLCSQLSQLESRF